MKKLLARFGALLLLVLLASGCASTIADRIKEKSAMFGALPESQRVKIQQGDIEMGYTSDMVYIALGPPNSSTRATTPDGENVTNVYRNYFSPDAVVFAGLKLANTPGSAGPTGNIGNGLPSEGSAHGDLPDRLPSNQPYRGGGDDDARTVVGTDNHDGVAGPDMVLVNLEVTFLNGKVTRFKVGRRSGASLESTGTALTLPGGQAKAPNLTVKDARDNSELIRAAHGSRDRDRPAPSVPSLATPRTDRVVELPPYVVKEVATGPKWRYARAPGLEIISHCLDSTTLRLIESNDRLRQLLEVILPREFQAKLDVPTTFVLYSQDTQPLVAQELIADMRGQTGKVAPVAGSYSSAESDFQFMTNYQFWDHDSCAIFFAIDETIFNGRRLHLKASYVRSLLEYRTPSLPVWFIEGMVELYGTVDLEPDAAQPGGRLPETAGLNPVVIGPARWISAEQTKTLKKNPKLKTRMIPLAELFSDLTPAHQSSDDEDRWKSQAALFIRWALDGENPARREALWKFIRLSGAHPPTEAAFRECFGNDYGTVEQQLQAYLVTALKHPLSLHHGLLSEPPVVEMREATDPEVSRLKGELNRLEMPYVKEWFPQLKDRYVEQAQRTLHRAYDRGERDPRLVASLGLCECDIGNDAAAQPLLVEATRHGVIRPRAYYELARITVTKDRAGNPAGPMSADQANEVLRLLFAARRQSPALPEVYGLISEVLLRSEAQLAPEQLVVVDEGVRCFPRAVNLITVSAILHARSGFLPEARDLIEQGLRLTNHGPEHARLLKLRAALGE